MPLRPYQEDAFNAVTKWLKKSLEPCVVEAATGAGKSIVIAALAEWLYRRSKKRVLVLQPSKELTEQNREKYLATGNPCSIFSASIKKCLKHPVIFGTPVSVLKSIDQFKKEFACVVVDEAHGLTESIKTIIDRLREANPKLRVVGLSATPYRMKTGYIYQYGLDGKPLSNNECIDPYFHSLVYQVRAHELIAMGFLTPPTTECQDIQYDRSKLVYDDKKDKFTEESVKSVFEHDSKTKKIVDLVVSRTGQRHGVMFFGATVEHAKEILSYLPPEEARMVDGTTKKKEREKIISDFKAMKFKYIVNCSVLTTGFDAPHVDAIAILRATESASLYQQIIGRALRLSTNTDKQDALIMDFAGNVESHFPDGDIFSPDIKAYKSNDTKEEVEVVCPECSTINTFTRRDLDDGLEMDDNGHVVDLLGNVVEGLSGHYGRRCNGYSLRKGKSYRCEYKWAFKECPECGHENDIAAKKCESCKHVIISPDEKLSIEFTRIKKDPYQRTTDKVLGWHITPYEAPNQGGNPILKVSYTTEYKKSLDVWYFPGTQRNWKTSSWFDLCEKCHGSPLHSVREFIAMFNKNKIRRPETITVVKEKYFYRVYGHNNPETTKDNFMEAR